MLNLKLGVLWVTKKATPSPQFDLNSRGNNEPERVIITLWIKDIIESFERMLNGKPKEKKLNLGLIDANPRNSLNGCGQLCRTRNMVVH